MKCPSCREPELVRVEEGDRDHVAVERCPSCRGCWLSVQDLDRVEAGVWSSIEELRLTTSQALSELLCPRCAAQMITLNPDDHKEIAVDRCPTCHGLWLDKGELERLHDVAVAHVAQHGGLKQRPDGWSLVRWIAYRVAEQWNQVS